MKAYRCKSICHCPPQFIPNIHVYFIHYFSSLYDNPFSLIPYGFGLGVLGGTLSQVFFSGSFPPLVFITRVGMTEMVITDRSIGFFLYAKTFDMRQLQRAQKYICGRVYMVWSRLVRRCQFIGRTKNFSSQSTDGDLRKPTVRVDLEIKL